MSKGLLADIYVTRACRECSLGGISSRCKQVTILGLPDGDVLEPSDAAPAVKIVRRLFGGVEYLHLEPITPGMWAAGGALVSTSDARFNEVSPYALNLHDRDLSKER